MRPSSGVPPCGSRRHIPSPAITDQASTALADARRADYNQLPHPRTPPKNAIQRLAGPRLGHNTRHVYVGDGIGDVVRQLISAGAKAAARLAATGLTAARNLGVELFQAAKPVVLRAATEAAAAGKTFCGRGLKTCLYQGCARQRTALERRYRPSSANSLARLYSKRHESCCPGVPLKIWTPRFGVRGYVCFTIRAAALGLKTRWSLPTSAALFSTFCRRPSAMRVSIRSSGASMSPRNPTPGNCCNYG